MIGEFNNLSTLSISLSVGEEIIIEIPYDFKSGKGWFAKVNGDGSDASVMFRGAPRPLIRGFLVENEKIGAIRPTDQSTASVVYLQKLDGPNRIIFFASTGETAVCNITQIPVHDHGSIMQGGPAYATYYVNSEEDGNQEQ